MRFASQFAIATLAALVSSKAIKLDKRAPALDVKLSAQGNTLVKAVVTNTGSSAVNLLNKGTFLDNAAVEKVTVSSDGRSHFYTILFTGSSQLPLSINKDVACAQGHLVTRYTLTPLLISSAVFSTFLLCTVKTR
jgi:Deuterolysin metalloprotease (M35) family